MAFDSFQVVFERSGTPLIDEHGSDVTENVLIHAMVGRETILVFVSRMGLDDYFPPAACARGASTQPSNLGAMESCGQPAHRRL